MKVHRSLDTFTIDNTVLTIGTFDGVHQGHNKLIDTLKKRAKETGGESVVMTFWPHPRLVLNPADLSLSLLCTLEERLQMLSYTGVDHVIVYPFTKEFSQYSSIEFVQKVLKQQLNVKHLVVGYDHAFGKNREGNYDFLKKQAKAYGFSIEQVGALHVAATNVSSSKIRQALSCGEVETANQYLNHPYFMQGNVVLGQKLGRTIGFPTANVDVERFKLIPKDGVYAVQVDYQGAVYNGMLNIGIRPTISDPRKNKTIEVNLFDFDGNMYGQTIKVYFAKRIRDEKRFPSIEALKKQLVEDKQLIQTYFKNTKVRLV